MNNNQGQRPKANMSGGGKKQGQFQGKRLAPLPEMERRGMSRGPKQSARTQQFNKQKARKAPEASPPSPPSGLSGDLNRLLGKLGSLSLETEDLLLIAVLYLMYRESGDKELLIMMGALLFL